ncbi:transcription factor SPT20 homolog isoform X3 [Xenopus laevis]|uniref:transcription factor SPT20 homolog isoform X3 n=1 Tax=Xenopus laevis TaxID=8355 RepID=A0A8J1MAD8_XENLA|nr:transcription factor SPT20 homolog isoform X3 [Xenopus laevis]XP_041438567.1 transcription factor SPT20 homolog isoform X3 [Xenopus laevis]XP_041438568.1 transcription factor SPT20 homolog isoform X3 [Xenopus laevis]XP_041438569.1 transcription factor SPT20 homolog isoform X3 [Xenopus laevis]
MQILELALDRAEYIIESARQRPPKRKHSSGGRKSVFHKLYDLYIEECEKEPEIKKLRRNVNLLEKLVMQESLSCLVVNLYPGNEGYSLVLRGKNGSDSETIRLPYEEGELLEYLDAEELPPILVDLLEKSQVNIFHCGCVITEIRDYRQSGNLKSPTYQSRHILLRPTMQTLVSDIHAITSDNHKWAQEDKLLLESQLILATAEPLCLDPSVSVTCTANRLLFNKQKMNTCPMKRCLKRYSKPSLNRQQEISNCPTPPQLKLLDYLHKRKERKSLQPQIDLKISKTGNCLDIWKPNYSTLTVPTEVDVEKYAKVEKSIKLDDSQPTVWPADEMKEDYIFECESGSPFQKAKLTVFQNVGNPLYFGRLQTFKSQGDNEYNLRHSQFPIGSKFEIDRVVGQYLDLFEIETKSVVKLSHSTRSSLSHSPLSPGKEIESDGIPGSVQSSVLGKGVKHRPPPIKLPPGSASSSSGNIFSSLQASGHLKSTTPPPNKPPSISRKQSVDHNQAGMLSPGAMSPASSSQRSGTPKPSTPTPTNTPASTPHPPDALNSTPITPSVTPTPQDSSFNSQATLLNPFAQQQMSLGQGLPVMTIPLSTMVTSITTGTTSTQVMANPTGLNFINVVGSVCGPQTLMSGSNPILGCNTGAITPAGINLSGILPSGGLVSGALPAAMQSASQAGGPFGLKTTSGLRPLNLLQLSGAPILFNPMQQQQQQVSQFSPQQPQQTSTSSPQQQVEQLGLLPSGMDQVSSNHDQTLSAQQAAVINLTGVGGFMPPQAAVLSQLGSAGNRPGQNLPSQRLQLPSALQQQQQQIQLQFLHHQMQQQVAMATAAQAAPFPPLPHSDSQSRSKRRGSAGFDAKP